MNNHISEEQPTMKTLQNRIAKIELLIEKTIPEYWVSDIRKAEFLCGLYTALEIIKGNQDN